MKWGILAKTMGLLAVAFMAVTANAQAKKPLKVELEEGNFVSLRGEVSSDSVSEVIAQISTLKAKHLVLYISSPGGSIAAGARLISAMKGSGKTFTCVADFAASMAFVITQSDPCQERIVTESSVLMQHQAAYGIEGKDANAKSMMGFIQGMLLALDTQQAGRVGLTLEQFRAKTHDDWWTWGMNNITEKTADREGLVSCDGALTKKHIFTVVDTVLFGKFKLEFNACPMIGQMYSAKPVGAYLVLSPAAQVECDKILAKIIASFDPRSLIGKGNSNEAFLMTP